MFGLQPKAKIHSNFLGNKLYSVGIQYNIVTTGDWDSAGITDM